MSKGTAIIIGTGLSGLSAGCFAQKYGFQTKILEHHSQPGGLTATWRRKNYMIDSGGHFITGYLPGSPTHEIFKAVGLGDPNLFVPVKTYGRYVSEQFDKEILITDDLKKFEEDLKFRAPQDKQIIEDFVKGIETFAKYDVSSTFMKKPPELMNFTSHAKFFWEMRPFIKYVSGKYFRPIKEYTKDIKSPWLKMLINSFFAPEGPVFFLFIIFSSLAAKANVQAKSGSEGIINSMVEQYKKLGGEIKYRSLVSKIIVKNNKASGVKLANGDEIMADHIISAGDGYNAIYNLLDGKYTNAKIDERYKTWRTCPPLAIVNYGLKREYAGMSQFTYIHLKERTKYHSTNFPENPIFVRLMNHSQAFAPPCKTLMQAYTKSDWDFWNNLRNQSREAYMEEKEKYSDTFLKILERYYPGIQNEIEMKDIFTPTTYHRFTLQRNGSWGGFSMNAGVFKGIERMLPGLQNFYMAGHWVVVGGVTSTIYSGKHAADLMLHKS